MCSCLTHYTVEITIKRFTCCVHAHGSASIPRLLVHIYSCLPRRERSHVLSHTCICTIIPMCDCAQRTARASYGLIQVLRSSKRRRMRIQQGFLTHIAGRCFRSRPQCHSQTRRAWRTTWYKHRIWSPSFILGKGECGPCLWRLNQSSIVFFTQ
jgi:hypothetical protein